MSFGAEMPRKIVKYINSSSASSNVINNGTPLVIGSNHRNGIRRYIICLISALISVYTLLLVVIISRHLDLSSQHQLQSNQIALVSSDDGDSSVDLTLSPSVRNFHNEPLQPLPALPDPVLGLIRLKGRRAAALLLSSGSGADLNEAKRKLSRKHRVCLTPTYKEMPDSLTALASFPGSGNTWIRYLVQQSTGYLTGSIYKDYSLLRNGFPAESVANGSVILVKTHEWGHFARRPFSRAILLIRDPFKTLLAEFNRRAGGHLGHAFPDRFLKGRVWRDFVTTQVESWSSFTLDWLNFTGAIHLIRYEDIMRDLRKELKSLLSFLNVTITRPTLECVLVHKNGAFKRPNKVLNFDPYNMTISNNITLRQLVEAHKAYVYNMINKFISNHKRKVKPKTKSVATNPKHSANDRLLLELSSTVPTQIQSYS